MAVPTKIKIVLALTGIAIGIIAGYLVVTFDFVPYRTNLFILIEALAVLDIALICIAHRKGRLRETTGRATLHSRNMVLLSLLQQLTHKLWLHESNNKSMSIRQSLLDLEDFSQEVKKMKAVTPLATLALTLLLTTYAFFAMNIAFVSAQGTSTTVTYESLGGTTNPPPGTNELSGEVTLTATPDPGFEFAYWLYLGPEMPHGEGGTVKKQYFDNPFTYDCAEGYTVEWQAVFVPTGAANISAGIGVEYVAAYVAIAALVVGVLAFVVGRRKT